MEPLLAAEGLTKHFRHRGRVLRALEGVSLRVDRAETLAVVGESGSGKTTLGRTILRLEEPSAGEIRFEGRDFLSLRGGALRAARRRMQVVFQDPAGSLNPRFTIEDVITEPMVIHGIGASRSGRRAMAADLLGRVGLASDLLPRRPHQLSGGQRQRVSLARALAPEPSLVVADEPLSALDVSLQGQILNLMVDLQAQAGLAYLFVAHDLRVVRRLAHRIAVMYLGRVVESGTVAEVYARPAHPYTAALLSSVPSVDPERRRSSVLLSGDPPSPIDPPPGCPFHPRCPLYARVGDERCRRLSPALAAFPGGAPQHLAACHLAPADVTAR